MNFRLPNYLIPVSDSMSLNVIAMLQSWDNLQINAFPLFAVVQQLHKIRQLHGVKMALLGNCSLWVAGVVSRSFGPSSRHSSDFSSQRRFTHTATYPSLSLEPLCVLQLPA